MPNPNNSNMKFAYADPDELKNAYRSGSIPRLKVFKQNSIGRNKLIFYIQDVFFLYYLVSNSNKKF